MHQLMRVGIVFMLAIAAGCGPSEPRRNPITGTVQFKGQPVKKGTINFRSEADGTYVTSGEIDDGKYHIPQPSGLPAGQYIVAITYPDPKVPAPRPDLEEAPGEWRPVREMLPAKYNDNTELKALIKEGPNDVSFDLK